MPSARKRSPRPRHLGVSPVWMSNVVAAPATSGGFVANCLYCVYLLRKNTTTKNFWVPELGINWLYGALMGAFWFGGLAVYGLGIYRMGDFGTVVGWPLLMGTVIITSNAAGFLTGEWAERAPASARIWARGWRSSFSLCGFWLSPKSLEGSCATIADSRQPWSRHSVAHQSSDHQTFFSPQRSHAGPHFGSNCHSQLLFSAKNVPSTTDRR